MRRVVTVLPPSPELMAVAEVAREVGGAGARRWLRANRPAWKVAYLHGDRHDLFWEFRLIDSLRWQAHLNGLPPALFRERCQRLAKALGLLAVLNRPVEALTPAQQALADLAAALLPSPDVLLWEDPALLLSPLDQMRVSSLIRQQCGTAGLIFLAVSDHEAGLGSFACLQPLQATR